MHCFRSKLRCVVLTFFLFSAYAGLRAQQLEIALYGAQLDGEETNHFQQSLRFQIDFYNTLFGDTIRENMRLNYYRS